jgi:Uma2 family endonuclease
MSTTVMSPQPAPMAPTGPQPYRWTCDEYRTLRGAGRFNDRRVMLIDGVILIMPLPDPPHNLSVGLIDDWLRIVFTTGYHVRNQMAFDVGTRNDPGPDLAVVAGSRRDLATRQATSAVLVVEVADSSLNLDTTTKAELYATAGVPDYWVIDLENRKLLVFRDPEPLPSGLGATAYRTRQSFHPNDAVSPLANPTVAVKVADLLP